MGEACMAPNYEKMYETERDDAIRLREICSAMEHELKREREARIVFEAQMEVVRLIFGGNKEWANNRG